MSYFQATPQLKNILWDFDGVLMDSMIIRDEGFEVVLKDHSTEEVEQLMQFHRNNGGLSRYVKFRYFFEKIKNQEISEEEVNNYAQQFSQVMLNKLVDQKLLIRDTLTFVEQNHQVYNMHIVSGSDQNELRHICTKLGIDKYFKSIHGSPTPKKQLVKELLSINSYKKEETILVGDSINDYEAAAENAIAFYGYNNIKLKDTGSCYVQRFRKI